MIQYGTILEDGNGLMLPDGKTAKLTKVRLTI